MQSAGIMIFVSVVLRFRLGLLLLLLLLLLDLRLIKLNRTRLVWQRAFRFPFLITAGLALVNGLRWQTNSAIEDHGPGAAVANLRIGDGHNYLRCKGVP